MLHAYILACAHKCVAGLQCVVKDDKATGKRVVAGTHWDFDSYGGTIKKKLGMPTQACVLPVLCLANVALSLRNMHATQACTKPEEVSTRQDIQWSITARVMHQLACFPSHFHIASGHTILSNVSVFATVLCVLL